MLPMRMISHLPVSKETRRIISAAHGHAVKLYRELHPGESWSAAGWRQTARRVLKESGDVLYAVVTNEHFQNAFSQAIQHYYGGR